METATLPFELHYLREVFWDIWNSEGWSWNEVYHYQVMKDMELDEVDIGLLRKAFSACSRFVRSKMNKKSKPSKDAKPVPKKGRRP